MGGVAVSIQMKRDDSAARTIWAVEHLEDDEWWFWTARETRFSARLEAKRVRMKFRFKTRIVAYIPRVKS